MIAGLMAPGPRCRDLEPGLMAPGPCGPDLETGLVAPGPRGRDLEPGLMAPGPQDQRRPRKKQQIAHFRPHADHYHP